MWIPSKLLAQMTRKIVYLDCDGDTRGGADQRRSPELCLDASSLQCSSDVQVAKFSAQLNT